MFTGYTIVAFYTLHIILMQKTRTTAGRILHTKTESMEMNKNLNHIPMGNYDIITLNVAYNQLNELPTSIFFNNNYKSLRKLYLDHNNINNISLDAFKGLNELKMIDLSYNNLTKIDPYQFQSNNKLNKLIITNNKLKFHRLQPFLMSNTIDTLILTSNNIIEIYEITFIGLPNLKRLYLNENDLSKLSRFSFNKLPKLSYLSLSYTKVHLLNESMFDKLPKSLDLEGTPLSKTFDPPLTKIREDSIRQLLQTLKSY